MCQAPDPFFEEAAQHNPCWAPGGELNIKEAGIRAVLKLLSEGNTVPFIARYRKELTGNLDEVAIKEISDAYNYQVNLMEKKENTIKLIDEKGMLTDDVRKAIMEASKLVEIDEIYKPFKEGPW